MPEPTRIDRAIRRAEQRQAQEAQAQVIPITVMPRMVRLHEGGELNIKVMPGDLAVAHPWLLVFEPAADAWHPVLLPPGSIWRLGPPPPPEPKLWTPGGSNQ